MIKFEMDEAGVFDILSIEQIKIKFGVDAAQKRLDSVLNSLYQQLGRELVDEILADEYYKNLYNSNELAFHLVCAAKKTTGIAKEVQIANDLRHECKNKLQKKFFEAELIEAKCRK